MSRHTIEVERDGERFSVAFGYDNPLSEYFIHVCRADVPPDEENTVFAVASYNTLTPHPDHPGKIRYNNSELLKLFEEWGCPPLACEALALDLPF